MIWRWLEVCLAMAKDWMGYGTYNVWFETLSYTLNRTLPYSTHYAIELVLLKDHQDW